MTAITTPDELFEFLEFDATKPEFSGLVRDLCRALYDYAQVPCETLADGVDIEEMKRVFHFLNTIRANIRPKITVEFDPREAPGCIKFYRLMLPPAGGFDEDSRDPGSWEIWDDETDYSDPRVEVDTTPPEPGDDSFALGKLGVLKFWPDVVDAFQKASEAADNP